MMKSVNPVTKTPSIKKTYSLLEEDKSVQRDRSYCCAVVTDIIHVGTYGDIQSPQRIQIVSEAPVRKNRLECNQINDNMWQQYHFTTKTVCKDLLTRLMRCSVVADHAGACQQCRCTLAAWVDLFEFLLLYDVGYKLPPRGYVIMLLITSWTAKAHSVRALERV